MSDPKSQILNSQSPDVTLSDEECARYAWQMSTPDIGEAGQRKLKSARVLITRVGGVGGAVGGALGGAATGFLSGTNIAGAPAGGAIGGVAGGVAGAGAGNGIADWISSW